MSWLGIVTYYGYFTFGENKLVLLLTGPMEITTFGDCSEG
jgi:hypothetical protein